MLNLFYKTLAVLLGVGTIVYQVLSMDQPYQNTSMPKKSLDEMGESELMRDPRISGILRGNSNTNPDSLIGLGFRKINYVLYYPLFGWPRAAVEALRLVAYEMQCPVQKAFDTYEIFILIPDLKSSYNDATIWIRPRDRDFKPLKDKKKEPKEEPVETEVIQPKKVMAAKA